jgi:hypothetical protein
MYPTATRYPGPANANSFRQKLAPWGTTTDPWTSARLGAFGSVLQPWTDEVDVVVSRAMSVYF